MADLDLPAQPPAATAAPQDPTPAVPEVATEGAANSFAHFPSELWTQQMITIVPVTDLIHLISTCKSMHSLFSFNSDVWKRWANQLWQVEHFNDDLAKIPWRREFTLMYRLSKNIVRNYATAVPDQLRGLAQILPDRLTVDYTNKGSEDDAMGLADSEAISVVQSRYPLNPFPLGRCFVGYFEITMLELNPKRGSGMGLAPAGFRTAMPGWHGFTIGFHGDDGHIYQEKDIGDKLTGKPWNQGDIIGCGINYITKEVFFTCNGQLIAAPTRENSCKITAELAPYLYPTLAIFRVEKVKFNFGASPFEFDLLQYQREHSFNTPTPAPASAAAATAAAAPIPQPATQNFIYTPLSRRVRNIDGMLKIEDQEWFDVDDHRLKDFGINTSQDVQLGPYDAELLEARRVINWHKEALDMLLNEDADIAAHKQSLMTVYNLLPPEERLAGIEALPDNEFRQTLVRTFTNHLYELVRGVVYRYAGKHCELPRASTPAEHSLQVSLKMYTLLDDMTVGEDNPCVQLIMSVFRRLPEQQNQFPQLPPDQVRDYLRMYYLQIANAEMEEVYFNIRRRYRQTKKGRTTMMNKGSSLQASPDDADYTPSEQEQTDGSDYDVVEAGVSLPVFRIEAVAPVLAVLEDTSIPDDNPTLVDFLVRTWAAAGWENSPHNFNGREYVNLANFRKLSIKYLREEVKHLKNWAKLRPNEVEIYKTARDLLKNPDNFDLETQARLGAGLRDCYAWKALEDDFPALVPRMKKIFIELITVHLLGEELPKRKRRGVNWLVVASVGLAAAAVAAVGTTAALFWINRSKEQNTKPSNS